MSGTPGDEASWTNPSVAPPWDPPAGEQWVWDAAAGKWVAKVTPTSLDADPLKDPGSGGGGGGGGGSNSGSTGGDDGASDGGGGGAGGSGGGASSGGGSGGGKGLGRGLAAVTAVAVAGAAAWGLSRGPNSSNSSSGSSTPSGPAAITPHNNKAVIYNKFGRGKNDGIVLDEIKTHLIQENYQVTEYSDPTEGRVDNGTATFDNFITLADASVIIINTHGYSPVSPNTVDVNCGTKALYRYPGELTNASGSPAPSETAQPSGSSAPGGSAPPSDSSAPSGSTAPSESTAPSGSAVPSATAAPEVCGPPEKYDQAQILVEWYPAGPAGAAARDKRYSDLVRSGVNPDWLSARGWQGPTTSPNYSIDGAPVVEENLLLMTAAGIQHYFSGKNITLVDGIFCHSIVFAKAFDAVNFFGYSNPSYPDQTQFDSSNLWDNLAGHGGVPQRPTLSAYAQALHSADFQLKGNRDVVLSPAVESVSPKDATRVALNTSTKGEVNFDANMDTSNPKSIISVSGCGATIEQPKWDSDGSKLTFMLKIPATPSGGDATLTVNNTAARASPLGFANELDGNSDPRGDSGAEPNRDDYTWHVSCRTGSSITVRYAGTFKSTYSAPQHTFDVNFTWDESRADQYTYQDFAFILTPGTPTLTASGSAVATNSDPTQVNQPVDSCSYAADPSGNVGVGVTSEGDSVKGGSRPLSINVGGSMPVSTGDNGGPHLLTHSGVCTLDSFRGPLPYLHVNPVNGGNADPGSFLQAAYNATADNVSVADLAKKPFTKSFPVDYTETDLFGGTEHVTVTATLTVTASG